MNVQVIEVFAVHGDNGGGSGVGPIEGYARTRTEATAAAQGRGWYGGPGYVSEAHALLVDGVMYALANPKPILFLDAVEAQKKLDDEERAAALRLLSPRQRDLLGLNKPA
jgi:hypothetical protein